MICVCVCGIKVSLVRDCFQNLTILRRSILTARLLTNCERAKDQCKY